MNFSRRSLTPFRWLPVSALRCLCILFSFPLSFLPPFVFVLFKSAFKTAVLETQRSTEWKEDIQAKGWEWTSELSAEGGGEGGGIEETRVVNTAAGEKEYETKRMKKKNKTRGWFSRVRTGECLVCTHETCGRKRRKQKNGKRKKLACLCMFLLWIRWWVSGDRWNTKTKPVKGRGIIRMIFVCFTAPKQSERKLLASGKT